MRSLWRILSLPRRSSGAQNGTAKIHLFYYATTLPTNFFEKIFFWLYISVLHIYLGGFLRKKRPFPGAFSADPDPVTLHFSEFFGDEGRKTFNIGLWRTGGRGQGSEDAIKR